MKERLTIGRLAKAAGVGVETVRFYQRRGLLAVPKAGLGKVREYDRAGLQRLRFIRKAQTAGFTLAEISELLKLDSTNQRKRIRAIAMTKLAELEERIRLLDGVRHSLSHLVRHCETAPAGRPCPIIVSFTAEHPAGC